MVFEMLKVLILLIFTIFFGIVPPELAAADASSSGAPETVPPKQKTAAAKKHEPTAKGETLKFDSREYEIRRYDLNKDGKPDIINVFKKIPNKKGGFDLHIYLKMMDLNHDSKIDTWRFFNEKTGAVMKEELDKDFDGKIDRTDYFADGIVVRSEFDSGAEEIPAGKNGGQK